MRQRRASVRGVCGGIVNAPVCPVCLGASHPPLTVDAKLEYQSELYENDPVYLTFQVSRAEYDRARLGCEMPKKSGPIVRLTIVRVP